MRDLKYTSRKVEKMKLEVIKEQRQQAENNGKKSVYDLQIGDFIFLNEYTLKNEGGAAYSMYSMLDNPELCRRAFCRVEQINFCKDADLFIDAFKFGPGGSRSDVFADEAEFSKFRVENLAAELSQYFYSKITLVIAKDSGRWLAVDAQGYDYPRYLLCGDDWREMFAEELAEEKKRIQEIKEKQQREDEERRQAEKERQEKEIADNWAFLRKDKSIKWNWIQICKEKFDFPVKVRKWTRRYNDIVHIVEVATEEQRKAVYTMLRELKNTFQYYTGESGVDDDGWSYQVIGNRLEDYAGKDLLNIEVKRQYN